MEKTACNPTKWQHRGAEEMMATVSSRRAPRQRPPRAAAKPGGTPSHPDRLRCKRSPNKSGNPHLPPAGKRDRGPNFQGPVQARSASSGAATAFKSMAYDLKVPKTPGAQAGKRACGRSGLIKGGGHLASCGSLLYIKPTAGHVTWGDQASHARPNGHSNFSRLRRPHQSHRREGGKRNLRRRSPSLPKRRGQLSA